MFQTFDWHAIASHIKIVAGSNFITALVGSLAGAFGGAWAAQRIAERSRRRDDLLKEMRGANAASAMLYGVATAHLGLKRQFVQPLRDVYLETRGRFELFERARLAGTLPPGQKWMEVMDMQAIIPLRSPTDQIQRLVFEELSLSASELFVLPVLLAALKSLGALINERNLLVAEWKETRPPNLHHAYFGIPLNKVADERYKTGLEGIYAQTNDVIAFSAMLGEALYEHAKAQKALLKKRFRTPSPPIGKMDLSRFKDFLPSPDDYEGFAAMFKATKQSSEKLSLYRRCLRKFKTQKLTAQNSG